MTTRVLIRCKSSEICTETEVQCAENTVYCLGVLYFEPYTGKCRFRVYDKLSDEFYTSLLKLDFNSYIELKFIDSSVQVFVPMSRLWSKCSYRSL